jgi:hypothetical protein
MTNLETHWPFAGLPEKHYGEFVMSHKAGKVACWCAVVLLLVAGLQARADQIVLQSGDNLSGRLLALTNDTVVLQSELLGILRLPRSKVVSINLAPPVGTNLTRLPVQTNLPLLPAMPGSNTGPDISASLRQLGSSTNSVQQVREQFLGAAGPEANKKFNEMLGGLMSGKLDVNDIRSEAASAASQLRALKRELGDDGGGALDGYLAILENFLSETGSTAGSTPKSASLDQKPTKAPAKVVK